MAKQITQLPVAASVAASDVFPLDQSGTTKQATLTAIAAGLPTGTGTGGLVRQTNPVFSGNTSVFAGALSSVSGSLVDIARWETTNNNVSFLRLTEVRNSTGSDWTTATTRLQKWVDVVPQGFIDFNPPGLSYAVSLGTVNGGGANVNVLTVTGSAGGNNVGIGTANTPSKLTVAGDIRLLTNGNALLFTDTGGTTPYMVSAVDGNFYFAGTTAAGAGRGIFQCAMRSDTSPLQVNVPLKIGADGANVAAIYTAVAFLSPPAIAANGGVQSLDVTVTGATNGMVCMVEVPGGLSNNSIVVKANYISADTVRVYFVNPTTSSVTLTPSNYRIACIKF